MKGQFVSIILPTYNGNKKWISESIQSVLDQTYTNFELIIINDASTNDIETTILAFAKKDERIKYYKNDENLQLTRTLNRWIKLSQWKYIARMDDDDIRATPDKLEKQMAFMEQNTDYGVVWSGVIIIDENGKKVEKLIIRCSDQDIRNNLLKSSQIAHASVLIRRSVLDDVWLYNEQRNLVEDQELWLRIGMKYKLYNIPECLFQYRINPHWVSIARFKKQRALWIKLLYKYGKHYPNLLSAMVYKIAFLLLPLSRSQKIISLKNRFLFRIKKL